uniref:Uncharacterized protein n=1 Tax=Tanacetum cinerariifolium TaxID=118510 RepID=A0A699IAK4_TANCI|nr:hypothetical protein [Tanacetum cinerariifolium]
MIFYEPCCENCGDQVVNLDSFSPKPLQCQKIPIYYDDDDDEESATPLRDIIISELPLCIAIILVLSTKETKDSLNIGDEHLDTIPEKESDRFIKSSVENLVPNPSESEELSNIGREYDVPVCDDFTTFSNSLFDTDNFSSSDKELFSDEDTPKKIYSNPPFDEEIISIKVDPHHFNVESDLIESLLNQDSLIISSSKLILFLMSSPMNSLFSNQFHRELDSDPFMVEINLFLTSDGSIAPGIDSDCLDSEGDNLFPKRLLHDDRIPLLDILDFSNVVRIFPSFFTYPMNSSILLSSGSEDTTLTPTSSIIISILLCRVYLIGVKLS